MIREYESVKVSRRVFDLLDDELDYMNDDGYNMSAHLEVFNNCREQGYVLVVYDYNNDYARFCVWAFEARNSDDIVIVLGKEANGNNMFNDEDYSNHKYFHRDEMNEAVNEIVEALKSHMIKK